MPTRKPMQIVEHLYNDYIVREKKQKQVQNQQKNTNTYKVNDKSNQILANKLAIVAQNEYSKFVQNIAKSLNAKLIEDIVEDSHESDFDEKCSSRKSHTKAESPSINQKILAADIPGINYHQFVELLPRLNYTNGYDHKDLLSQAWKMISFMGPSAERVVNLRNFIMLVLGIENIFLPSMLDPERDQRSVKSQRQFGYFIGQNFFLHNELDCKKLSQLFQAFMQFKTASKQVAQKQAQNQSSFTPRLNEKSKKIITKKLSHVYSTSRDFKKKGHEEYLINKGKLAQIKKDEMKKLLEKEETRGCTFRPEINNFKKSKSQINVFENLYRAAET